MPKVSSRKLSEVPLPGRRTSRKNQVKQAEYDSYIRMLDGDDVGDLELDEGENTRAVKMSLHQAAARRGIELQVWDVGNHVYFRESKGGSKRRKLASNLDIHRAMSREQNSEPINDLFGSQ